MNMSRQQGPWLSALCAVCLIAPLALSQGGIGVDETIYVDFGSAGNSTPGNWNNMTSVSGTITNAITDGGRVTGIGFALPDRFNGINENGTTTPDPSLGLPMEATRNSFFGNDVIFSGATEPTAQLVISGLEPSMSYELTLFCSRMGVGDNRQTQYAISGEGGLLQILYLDPANNVDKDVKSMPIRPTAAGEIVIDIQGGPENNNGNGFFYLGALVLRVGQTTVTASQPFPVFAATDVATDVTLAWTPSASAATHTVYLGTDADAVESADAGNPLDVLLRADLSDSAYEVEVPLAYGQTYYWRVDEVNGAPDFTVFKGDVWSFTVEPFAYPLAPVAVSASSVNNETMGPEKTIDGSGMDASDRHGTISTHMWLSGPGDTEVWIQYAFERAEKLHQALIWNSNQGIETLIGFGSKTVVIETSIDGATWSILENVPEFAQGPGRDGYAHNTVVDFAGVTARYVRLTIQSGWGLIGQYGLSEVRFFATPVYARLPQPADGATLDSVDVTLQWRAGREAAMHEVLLDSNRATVEDGSALVAVTEDNAFTSQDIHYGTTYYWRIDEVNQTGFPDRREGDIWHFDAPEYQVIDDFEMYSDAEFLEIWAFWVDGFEDNRNGAIVGNENIGERSVVYEGGQSMPIHYDNSGTAISEVTRGFDPPLDWLSGEPATLSVHVRGNAPDFLQAADGTLVVGAAGADIWGTADEFRFVYKRMSGDGSIVARVDSLESINEWSKAGVMVRETLTPEAAFVNMVATGTNGVTFQGRLATFASATSDSGLRDDAALNQDDEPVWVRMDRSGNEFNAYWSLDGSNWTPSVWNPQTVTMVRDVYVGMCVTSHDVGSTTTAVFSELTTTGNVSGAWLAEAIGGVHPSNDAAPVYIVVSDTSGRQKTLSHPDTTILLGTTWVPWQVPLADLSPVDLSSIASVTIGIGDSDGPASGATGTAYIDLLRIGTPFSEASQ